MGLKTCSTALLFLTLTLSFRISESLDLIPNFIKDPLEKLLFQNKCTEDYGCFYTGPPFYDLFLRPITLPPWDVEKITTRFQLYTPDNVEEPYFLEPSEDSLFASPFDKELLVKFYIHGYSIPLDEHDFVQRIKNAYLEQGDYNVIIVDWTDSNGSPYVQAAANARVVGAQVAQLVNFLKAKAGVQPESVHIVGHSMGAHVSGWAGERIPGLGRITGLDAAGPFFRGSPPIVRLDETDAKFVDIIHTNAAPIALTGYGIPDTIGDLDFYPNGGISQPGCEKTLLNFSLGGIDVNAVATGDGFTSAMTISCNHNRVVDYYIESITDEDCTFIGTKCSSYEKYEDGNCNENPEAVMGFGCEPIPNVPKNSKFYLDTEGTPPYCIF